MINSWTLKVKDFGKISKADIKITPFMMFVGENNSGKSYILQLLWGIFIHVKPMIRLDILKDDQNFIQLLNELENKIKGINFEEGDEIHSIEINEDIQIRLMNILNKLLYAKKEWLVNTIFNYPIRIGHLEVSRDFYLKFKLEAEIKKVITFQPIKESDSEEENFAEVPSEMYSFKLMLQSNNETENIATFAFPKEDNWDSLSRSVLLRIIETLVCRDYSIPPKIRQPFVGKLTAFRRRTFFDPIYFPASRTGFMYTYQTILGNERKNMRAQLKDKFLNVSEREEFYGESQRSNLRLTQPVQDFLEKLSEIYIDDQQEAYLDELEFLNKNVFQGRVILDQANNYRFTPADSKEGLPLQVTSSLVAELAPISIFLASQYDPELFIIEESESHLHVKKQLELVRLFFRLINKGKSVWLTTHSDSFAQQVNNLLTLSQHSKKEELFRELGYEEVDTLKDVSYSSCYQFKSKDGKTIVEEIELGPYGYVIPTFNNVLERLLIETSKIQNIGEVDG
ncbi:AAA family ATPase [Paenibacillus sp. NRS-1782]|uniref:AAA family ATPase n=1 Tax=unclassified Paenibacillus TaxID=185978 RepID=UPI003D28F8E6